MTCQLKAMYVFGRPPAPVPRGYRRGRAGPPLSTNAGNHLLGSAIPPTRHRREPWKAPPRSPTPRRRCSIGTCLVATPSIDVLPSRVHATPNKPRECPLRRRLRALGFVNDGRKLLFMKRQVETIQEAVACRSISPAAGEIGMSAGPSEAAVYRKLRKLLNKPRPTPTARSAKQR